MKNLWRKGFGTVKQNCPAFKWKMKWLLFGVYGSGGRGWRKIYGVNLKKKNEDHQWKMELESIPLSAVSS